jgi:hypothetical protein
MSAYPYGTHNVASRMKHFAYVDTECGKTNKYGNYVTHYFLSKC